jgi:accessory gene regulator protein AgrB
LITLARTIIDEYNTLERFCVEAINIACYASNRIFSHQLVGKASYELLKRKKLDISFFLVFECKCYIYKECQQLGKFQRGLGIGFLLHYSLKSKAYSLLTIVRQ